MSFGPRCDVRNTTIYGCGASVTEGGSCPHCPIDPYGAENAKSSILLTAIREGRVNMKDVDRAAGNVLRAKFAARLFDSPYRDPAMVSKVLKSTDHRQLARQAATESAILLKNVGPPPPRVPCGCRGNSSVGMDWEGSDNQSFVRVNDLDECCAVCTATRWCHHYSLTYASMDCFMKGGNRRLVPAPGVTAGLCAHNDGPPPPPPPLPPPQLLPMDKSMFRRVAVLGPNGDCGSPGVCGAMQAQLGQYECTADLEQVVTVEQGIRNLGGIEVVYSAGAGWSGEPSAQMIDEAVAGRERARARRRHRHLRRG